MRRVGLVVVVALALDIAVALVDAAPARKVPVIGYLAPEAESSFGGLNEIGRAHV